jgi:hypothetical protein
MLKYFSVPSCLLQVASNRKDVQYKDMFLVEIEPWVKVKFVPVLA